MASNTLNDRSDGETITKEFFNDIHQALDGDFVGRNSSGVPTASQNLGTAAIPWGTLRASGLIVNGSTVDTSQISAPTHRVTAGVTRSTSNQPAYLVPAGSGGGASVTVDGTPTSLQYTIAATAYTLSADLVKSSLTTAPSTNNTALVNDTDAADQAETRTWGEPDATPVGLQTDPGATLKTSITIDTAGSEITSRVGQYHAFKINDGSNDEYFTALIVSATELTNCRRGFFYDSSTTAINRIAFADGDTITLMSMGYVFLDEDTTTVDVTYTQPQYQNEAPGSPSTGDYWFDIPNSLWKRYDGATFQTVGRTFIGWVCVDDTDCIAARSEDLDARYKLDMNIEPVKSTTEIIKASFQGAMVHVAGNEIHFKEDLPEWNMTTDLATSTEMYNATEQSNTAYYCYMSDEGEEIISDIEPYRRQDLNGFYHPHNPWRALAAFTNDGSSDIIAVTRQYYTLERRYTATRFLTANVTTNGEATDLAFDDELVVGKTYLMTGRVSIGNSSGDDSTSLNIYNGTAAVSADLLGNYNIGEFGGSTQLNGVTHVNIVFVAKKSSLRFDASSIGGTSAILGSGNVNSTYIVVHELPGYFGGPI